MNDEKLQTSGQGLSYTSQEDLFQMLTRRAFALTLTALPASLAGAEADVAAARKAAEAWLALVDAGDYAQSRESAASAFKEKVTKEQWARAVGAARGPLGAFEGREFAGAKERTSLPGAPDGEYVVIGYKAQFANKADAGETVTPMKDSDGAWRVSGYYVR